MVLDQNDLDGPKSFWNHRRTRHKIELANLVRSYRVLEKYYELNDKIGDTAAIWTGEKEEINDIGDEIGDLGDKVKDFDEVESVFKKIYEEGLDDQSMVDLWGLKEYKNYKPTTSKQEPLNI